MLYSTNMVIIISLVVELMKRKPYRSSSERADGECGAQLTEVIGPFGKTVEYGIPVETDFDVFRMTSYYYFCEIDGELGEQALEGYEIDLGLQPKWVEISEALKANEEVLVEEPPLWTKRETIALRLLEERLSSKVGKGHDQV